MGIYGKNNSWETIVAACSKRREALPNYILKIKFNNNEEKYFDVKKIYDLPCYKLLQNKEFFETVHVEYGCIAWNNDIDYCPDCLCEESTER